VIASVRGTVTSIALDHAVIEVGGVGFAVRTTPSTLAGLRRGEPTTLSTSLVVREDSLTLYGFATSAAKELFELVQSVSGVGPKIALALLAVLDPDELRRALATADATALMRAPGIGRKGAERLILELKDKVGPAGAAGPTAAVAGAPSYSGQLVDALAGLGFTPKQSSDAVAEVTADASDPAVADGDVAVLLRRALGLLGRSR
jgi:Holliday junction DNA helicase RuvA